MPRRNRVDPWGDLYAVEDRGMFTGNRGCLVDDERRVVRHHMSNLWITCVTEFGGRRFPLDAPHRWTPLFFLDDAVALAAGHRPCYECRRADYLAYKEGVSAGLQEASRQASRPHVMVPLFSDAEPAEHSKTRPGRSERAGASAQEPTGLDRPWATTLNRRLAAERLRRGGGIDRGKDRRTWTADVGELPDGAVVVDGGTARLVVGDRMLAFGFAGWHDPRPRPARGAVDVLTPPTSVLALRNGYRPPLHESAFARGTAGAVSPTGA